MIYLLRQMCGSLYEAHSKGLVHRDVKPANLFLTRRGGEADVVKVLDFGLVRAREEQRDGDADDRSMAGTPLYMSPEAIQMPGSVDGCSDIYAVGAVGYFLLTGRTVFEASTVMELCNKHLNEPPVAPSRAIGQTGASRTWKKRFSPAWRSRGRSGRRRRAIWRSGSPAALPRRSGRSRTPKSGGAATTAAKQVRQRVPGRRRSAKIWKRRLRVS